MKNRLTFAYDMRGRGVLRLCDGDAEQWAENCRTGSIDRAGMLINGLPLGRWYLCAEPVETSEAAMIITGERIGWKCRLYRHNEHADTYTPTSYLIHPDGGKGGTLGCIGTQAPAWGLRDLLQSAIIDARPEFIPLDVWRE